VCDSYLCHKNLYIIYYGVARCTIHISYVKSRSRKLRRIHINRRTTVIHDKSLNDNTKRSNNSYKKGGHCIQHKYHTHMHQLVERGEA